MDETYSVAQWFPDGQYEYVRRNVSIEKAMDAAKHYCTCVGARFGTTVRVIIEDGGGCCIFEWERENGIIFPEELKGMLRNGIL